MAGQVLVDIEKRLAVARKDFPVLAATVHDKPLAYLDNAATTQKPNRVSDRMYRFYTQEYATIHRGVYTLSQLATQYCDEAREKVARFLGAPVKSIVFTKGATEAINLVAASYGRAFLNAGDEIVISAMEHHANIVPWQQLRDEKGIRLRVVPITDRGELDQDAFLQALTPKTKLVAMTHVSNALGTVNDVKFIIEAAHKAGAKVLLDGAQAVSHLPVNVAELDCDFYVLSAHKLYGPTGIGALYGKYDLLSRMTPYQVGGDMIESVTFEKTTFAKPPQRFEAGTPPIAEIIGFGEAVDYVSELGFEAIAYQEEQLLRYATERLAEIAGLRIIGTARRKAAVISFVMDEIHPHDVGTILDAEGIAVRAGHHCTQPVMERFKIPATTRASFAFYNTMAEVDRLIAGLYKVREIMG